MKRNVFHLLALLAGLLIYSSAIAQTRGIDGTVTDEKKQPISFASVIIKGTSKGTTTAQDGSFKLEVSPNAILIIRAVGYNLQEIPVNGEQHFNISLTENASDLNEVVVTALGVKKEKRNLTFSAQEVKSDEVLRAKEPNVLNALTGKVAGVQITSSSGMPGSSARIVIRGITSISGENQALFVMDGVPINNDESGGTYNGGSGTNRLADIDPSTIESINVLKGAAATALYGSAGARGVVLVTTRKGAAGRKPVVTLSSGLSFEKTIFPDRQYLYAQGDKGVFYDGESMKSSTSWGPRMDTLTVNGQKIKAHNPLEEFFRTGVTSNSTVSVSGGGSTSNYFMSYSYFDQKGTIPVTSYKRHSVFTKYNAQIIDKLNATFQLTYSTANNKKVPEGYGLESPLWTIFTAPVSYDLKPALNPDGSQRLYRYSRNNPYWVLDNVLNTTVVNRFLPVFTFVYTPFEWLSVTERAGADIYTDQQTYHVNTNDITYATGLTYYNNKNFRQFNHDFIVQLRQQFNNTNVSLLLGNNVYSEHGDFMTALGLGLAKPGYYNMASASSITYTGTEYLRRKTGFYAQAEVDYNRMLVLSLTGRYDGSSVLSSENRYYPYGSVAGGFIFSELFKDKLKDVINFGKVRASFASVGNDNVKPYATTTPYYQAVIYGDVSSNLTFPYNGQNGFLISSALGNPNLKNELQKEYELGLEMKMFKSRVGLEASYFNRRMTQGIVENISLANSTGYASTTINSAKMSTKGIEVLLNVTPVTTKDFSWDITINYTKLKQKVEEISPDLDQTSIGSIYAKKGEPWGLIFGTKYARTADGQLRINEAGLPYASGEFDVVGNITPDWIGGITNQLRYKQFNLSFFFDTKQGGDILNSDDGYGLYYGSSKQTEKREDRVVPGVSDANNAPNKQVVTGQAYFQQISGITEAFIQHASYIKLRNVSLSYTFRKGATARTPFKDASIVLTGRNLWIHKDKTFTGGDPEVNSWGAGNGGLGVYTFSAPTARSFDCTLKFTF
ncbi:SusC/RagA family TonB-linked outer membrane protein [Chitinophaga pinensis]|uniref:TonB-dependent receptor plug n=1 Tax=Chitinophaga pinensis (strain ATCC 43595 / DSM 2588 / LMG 13176 / NBRC 15968 / NCIMB 11800 / UQM 2034) TaxID=485918 RepID=A0A979GN20_CHIPD|nr:SusC/RagA family TonB-linked outer membrane protein [Chitinophaga pinensis]ACU57903.1 TonB-dependent receptor plug [Chitinophaga pinensis DSM 2588]